MLICIIQSKEYIPHKCSYYTLIDPNVLCQLKFKLKLLNLSKENPHLYCI